MKSFILPCSKITLVMVIGIDIEAGTNLGTDMTIVTAIILLTGKCHLDKPYRIFAMDKASKKSTTMKGASGKSNSTKGTPTMSTSTKRASTESSSIVDGTSMMDKISATNRASATHRTSMMNKASTMIIFLVMYMAIEVATVMDIPIVTNT